jgi:hypothetical protein
MRPPKASALFCIIAGCTGTNSSTDAVVRSEELPRLELQEEFRIGNRDDPQVGFTRIGAVSLLGDGNLVVLETAERQLRIYNANDGRLMRAWGGRGFGPGEFQSPGWIGARNDTVWVGDMLLGRLTIFNTSGELLLTLPAHGVDVPAEGISIRVVPDAPIGNGRFGSRLRLVSRVGAVWADQHVPAFVFDSTGSVVDTLGSHFFPAGGPTQIIVDNDGVRLPTFAQTHPLIIPVANDTVVVEREPASSSGYSEFTITRSRADGTTAYRTRVGYQPIRLVRDSIISEVERLNSGLGVDRRAIADAVAPHIPRYVYHPPVSRFVIGSDGAVWLQREEAGGDSTQWVIVDDRGTVRGMTRLPKDTRLAAVTSDAAWLISADDMNIPWLVKVRVRSSLRAVAETAPR